MFAIERHQKVVELLNQRDSIRVTELAKMLQVTEETIRRDLEKLESLGKVLRIHGGALSVRNLDEETPFKERKTSSVVEKKMIAKEALRHIKEGDVIMLDASTTTWQMAKLLPNINLTVVTNAIKVAVELAVKSKIRVISTGGTLASESLSYVGPIAEKSLEGYHVNKVFLSCQGFNLTTGLSDASALQAMVKKRMISVADYCYLLVDHSKFGEQSLANISDVRSVHTVITDNKVNQSNVTELNRMGIIAKIAN